MTGLKVLEIGPGVSLQDAGRPGYMSRGLSRGGALDQLALHEGAALVGHDPGAAALEIAGFGGLFEATGDTTIALTGAGIQAACDGVELPGYVSLQLAKGARLRLGGVLQGSYAYLHVAGGFDAPLYMGARATHRSAGLGLPLDAGTHLAAAGVAGANRVLSPEARLSGGEIRIVPSAQTDQFDPAIRQRFETIDFIRDARSNRQGVRLTYSGDAIAARAGLSIVSETVIPGDVQIAGDGQPFVLLTECQTTGGYPRIASVLPSDLPRMVQAPTGSTIRFRFVSIDEARQIEARARAEWAALPGRVRPLVRDPRDMPDLLAYNLVSGAVTGD